MPVCSMSTYQIGNHYQRNVVQLPDPLILTNAVYGDLEI